MTGFIASIEAAPPTSASSLATLVAHLRQTGPVTSIPLPHHIHNVASGWQKSNPATAPTALVEVTLDRPAYGSLSLPPPSLHRRSRAGRASGQKSILDTGAQVTVIPVALLHTLGIMDNSVFSTATSINAVNSAPVDISGGVLLKFTATNPRTGVSRSSRQLCYISNTVPAIYLSKEACIDLGTIPANFPEIGQYSTSIQEEVSADSPANDIAAHCAVYGLPKCSNSGVVRPEDTPCNCPTRSLPPTDRPALPCAPTVENLPHLKQWILERYKASAFNCCEQQTLPLMTESPPLHLHIDPTATLSFFGE